MNEKCIVWSVSDGKMGHVNQMRGLIAALSQKVNCEAYTCDAPSRWQATCQFFRKQFDPGRDLPDPHLIVCAGSSSHIAALAARRHRGGRLVVMMKPSFPISWFDVCIVPKFNRVEAGPRVITVIGPLSVIEPAKNPDPNRGLVLIGGPSGHHGWSDGDVTEQIRNVLHRQPQIDWTLLTSRRTPDSIGEPLRKLEGPNVRVVLCENAPQGAVPSELQRASQVWVTQESISMTYEALASGASVGVLQLPFKRRSRVHDAIRDLIEEEAVVSYEKWSAGMPLKPSSSFYCEREHCVEELLVRLPELSRFLHNDRGAEE